MIRPSNQHSLKEVIDELINTYRLREGLNEAKLRELWESLMGKVIASKTSGLYFKNNVLQVRLTSAPLRQELQFKREEIKKALNEALEMEVVSEVILA